MSSNLTSFVVCFLVAVAGCGSKSYLMPTPSAYTNPEWNPFADVPPALQGNNVSVLYVTDRAPEKQTPDHWEYGSKRSRSAAFGEAQVRIGKDASWEEVVQASRTAKRKKDLTIDVVAVNELARFGPTPIARVLTDEMLMQSADAMPRTSESAHRFTEDLTARLAATPRKEVYFYVHGFDNSFE